MKEHFILFFAMFALIVRMSVSMSLGRADVTADKAYRNRNGVGNSLLDQ